MDSQSSTCWLCRICVTLTGASITAIRAKSAASARSITVNFWKKGFNAAYTLIISSFEFLLKFYGVYQIGDV